MAGKGRDVVIWEGAGTAGAAITCTNTGIK